MITSRLHTSRRTTLALVLTAPLTLAGCELDPPTATFPDPPSAAPVPDAEVVASARKAIVLVVASAEVVITTHRGLGPELSPWLTLHSAHLEVLQDGSADYSVAAPTPASTAAVARERLLAQEADLAGRLADAALQATSGDLARALASMSAALRQRVIV